MRDTKEDAGKKRNIVGAVVAASSTVYDGRPEILHIWLPIPASRKLDAEPKFSEFETEEIGKERAQEAMCPCMPYLPSGYA
jgi:hypothetical protein